jgi:biotin operon repressor
MLVAGLSNKEIGEPLGIVERTVKAHIAKMMRKVGVQNRIALSVHAVTYSLVSSPAAMVAMHRPSDSGPTLPSRRAQAFSLPTPVNASNGDELSPIIP